MLRICHCTKRKSREPASPTFSCAEGVPSFHQIQYRSYQHDIQIYHYRSNYVSLRDVLSTLKNQQHGYMESFIGIDTLKDFSIPNGDEVPEGCIEVGYLPGIYPFRKSIPGCALGFRVGNDEIHWLAFNQPIDKTILNRLLWNKDTNEVCFEEDVGPDDERRLFDLVAYMPKGRAERRVLGSNAEHKAWHRSLWDARSPPVNLKLTWKNAEKARAAEAEEAKSFKAQKNRVFLTMTKMDDKETQADHTGINSTTPRDMCLQE